MNAGEIIVIWIAVMFALSSIALWLLLRGLGSAK